MGKKKLILGYTRAGHEVLLPNRRDPDMAEFVSWTPGDHIDASRILVEHGERETDPIGPWCALWANEHRAMGKRRKKKKKRRTRVLGAAETTILARGRR
jgi:hypothetical protein